MSFHAFIIGEMDQELSALCRMISNDSNQIPVYITQGTDQVFDFLSHHDLDAIFIRIDVASNNGLEITRRLKEKFPQIKLIWMSYSDRYALDAFIEGVDAFIELPMTRENMHDALKRLERHQGRLSDAM